ncbi:MAG: tetratricopeptide repeat protein, partial [Conexivisphaera sp.]
GAAYADVHEFQRAIEYYQRAISIYEKLSRDNPAYLPGLAMSYSNLCVLSREMRDDQMAAEYCQKAAEIHERLSRG